MLSPFSFIQDAIALYLAMQMNKRISISLPQQPLQSPFLALSSEGLPDGPAHALGSAEGKKEPAKKPRIVLRREKSQRGGKTVIVVGQLPTHLSATEIEKLSRDSRKALGCGGCVRGREIELQGDQADRVRRYFEELSYEVAGP
jgi:translation initiation factor 1